jgi:hypothetical protein
MALPLRLSLSDGQSEALPETAIGGVGDTVGV